MDILRFVLKADADRCTYPCRATLALEAEQQGLRPVEGEMQRVRRDDGRQHRLVRSDSVAGVHATLRNLPRDRRQDPSEADIELTRAKEGGRGRDVGIGRTKGSLALLHFLDARRALRRQGARAREFGPGVDRLRLGSNKLRPGLVELCTRRTCVDREEQLPAANILPVPEVGTDQIAGDARLYVDILGGFEPADEIVPVYDLAGQRGGNRDFGRRRGLLRFGSARTSRGRERQEDGRNG